tara:strand:- start:11139 stop:11477 length:339 start_codon:yes stop_codon:yes gene_type:complete
MGTNNKLTWWHRIQRYFNWYRLPSPTPSSTPAVSQPIAPSPTPSSTPAVSQPIAPSPTPPISSSSVLGACINEYTSGTTVGACVYESTRVSVLGVNIQDAPPHNTAGYSDWY